MISTVQNKQNERLPDIMNRMAAGAENALDRSVSESGVASVDRISGVGLMMALDGKLAALHRRYIDARQEYLAVVRKLGAGTPMADVAAEVSEAAWVDMEIRMAELENNPEIMALVERDRRTLDDILAKDAAYLSGESSGSEAGSGEKEPVFDASHVDKAANDRHENMRQEKEKQRRNHFFWLLWSYIWASNFQVDMLERSKMLSRRIDPRTGRAYADLRVAFSSATFLYSF